MENKVQQCIVQDMRTARVMDTYNLISESCARAPNFMACYGSDKLKLGADTELARIRQDCLASTIISPGIGPDRERQTFHPCPLPGSEKTFYCNSRSGDCKEFECGIQVPTSAYLYKNLTGCNDGCFKGPQAGHGEDPSRPGDWYDHPEDSGSGEPGNPFVSSGDMGSSF